MRTLIAVLALAGTAWGQEKKPAPPTPPELSAKARLILRLGELDRERLLTYIDSLTKTTAADRDSTVSLVRTQLVYWPSLNLRAPTLGEIGRFRHGYRTTTIEVLQVLGKDELLVVPTVEKVRARVLWLKGVSTEGIVDGQAFKSDRLWEVTGTRQYTAVAGGVSTVFVLEPVPDAVGKEVIAHAQAKKDAASKAGADTAKQRAAEQRDATALKAAEERTELLKRSIAGLRSADTETRRRSAKTLGDFGENAREAVPVLKELAAKDVSEYVRAAAAAALKKIEAAGKDKGN